MTDDHSNMSDKSIALAFVSVGSNIDPEANIKAALLLLIQQVRVTAVSPFYQTVPIDRPQQPYYLNGVFEIQTDLEPTDIKSHILGSIETQLVRVRTDDAYAPRTMDLDLILYNDLVLHQPQMQLPHPDIQRPFVWSPIWELLEHGISHPDLRQRMLDLLPAGPPSSAWGKPIQAFTQELRVMIES